MTQTCLIFLLYATEFLNGFYYVDVFHDTQNGYYSPKFIPQNLSITEQATQRAECGNPRPVPNSHCGRNATLRKPVPTLPFHSS